MRLTAPPHPYCWVQTKWGRHKSKAIVECSLINKKGAINKLVLVEMIGAQYNKQNKQKLFKIKNIEYIK